MRISGLPRSWRHMIAVPLVIWLVLSAGATTGLTWAQQHSRTTAVQRFELRLDLVAGFVTDYVTDVMSRQRVQAEAMLADRRVTRRDFARSVAGLGYPAAVLLDGHGRLLQAIPADPGLTGTDLTGTYEHLRTAVRQGVPAVSPVVPSAVRGEPVVAFAVPFDTPSGRRVFSGAVTVTNSPLSAYLSSTWAQPDIRVRLSDQAAAIVAANHPVDQDSAALDRADPALTRALTRDDRGRYHSAGQWWRYASLPIAGTPWRVSAAAPETVLYASIHGAEIAGRVAVLTAALVGLLVVAAAARTRQHRRNLSASEERFRNVFDHSRIGMLISDPHGTLLRANPAVVRMLGRPADDLIGRPFTEITHPDDADTCVELFDDCLAGRLTSFEVSKRYRHADGHDIDVVVTTVLLRDTAGRPQLFAAQILNVTERNALQRARDHQRAELAERAEQLQQANTQMTDFITMLSHDVRQPLTGILARAGMLLEEWTELPDAERVRYVQHIAAAGQRADDLVTEILTLAQLDAGKLVARPVQTDLAHAVRQAVASHTPQAGQPITVLSPDQVIALADPAHLQLILGNLIGNALKYGAPPVTVRITNRFDHIDIHISDSGEGIPDAFIPHLFDRFTRADTGIAPTKPGTGLGLYLVRQLAEANHITIGYRPHQPSGSTFTLTLPRPTPTGSRAITARDLRPRDHADTAR